MEAERRIRAVARGFGSWLPGLLLVMGACATGACRNESTFPFPELPEEPSEPEEPLVSPGNVRGRVCSPSGFSWVGGAEVRVRGADQVAKTDASGLYWLEGLAPGPADLDVTKGSFATTLQVEVVGGETINVDPSCLGGDVSVAVVTGLYDNIEHLLADLGLPYNQIEITDTVEWLRDPESLSTYDIVFFNCGMRNDWVMYPEVVEHLRSYVTKGGSVYVSDEAYLVIEDAFPDAIDFRGEDRSPLQVQRGLAGTYVAEVVDRELQNALGSTTAEIRYDLRNWTIAEEARGGEVLLRANVLAAPDEPDGLALQVPSVLAARARIGQGTVVFTSFHNETQTGSGTQATPDMLRILEDIILSL